MKKTTFYVMGVLCALGSSPVGADPFEWSDIAYIEGRYSRIYFDYVQKDVSRPGTFYVINDWVVNRADGGVEGGLKAGEYNRFPFTIGSDDYEIRIYGDLYEGKYYDILVNGVSDLSALEDFEGAFGWRTSPNMPDLEHTIWEFSFEIAPTRIMKFVGCDPVSQTAVYPDFADSGVGTCVAGSKTGFESQSLHYMPASI